MGVTKRYTIAYKGLKPGLHDFRFEVDGSLFEEFESPEIKDGACEVTVALERGEAMLTLDVTVDGSVVVECDRCLEEFMMPVRYEGTLHVRYSDCAQESAGEVMWISPSETELNVAQYIYESICLSLPYQRVHPDASAGRSTCDPDMLSRFRIVSEEEFDRLCPGTETDGSSPWEKLKEIKPSK